MRHCRPSLREKSVVRAWPGIASRHPRLHVLLYFSDSAPRVAPAFFAGGPSNLLIAIRVAPAIC